MKKILLLTGLLLAMAAPARAELVYTADGRAIYGQVRTGGAPGALVVEADGAPVTLQREDVSAIEFGPPVMPRQQGPPLRGGAPAALVMLRNGDRLRGTLRHVWPPAVERDGAITVVPPAWVAGVRVGARPAATAAGAKDAVELKNGDRVEGHLEGAREGRLRVSTSVGPVSIDPARIQAIVMASGDGPVAPARGIEATLETTGGERITGEWRALTATEVHVKPAWGEELAVPRERALRLSVLNGRLIFLSDVRPAEVQQTPYFESHVPSGPVPPYQVDRSDGGRLLRLGGRIYARGLGVHSRSALTYTLAGSFKAFAATIGIDSEVGNGGSVLFRIAGDDRTLYQSPVMRGGDAPVPVTVDVSGVLLLRLEVDYADSGDVADHADWAEARLLK